MSKAMVKDLKIKIADYKRFSFVLLGLSAFLYLGSIIPFEGKQGIDQIILLAISYSAIGVALFFYRKITIWKKVIKEQS
ncbi:YrhC family protein [Alkalihalobacillus sp. AL-G]|uniref:YrhC family protein n=1 Tax=Alkalihalobacillus sp. AL-G TaxID=2926399 RepID=UPI00272B6DBA|nr:YrhC family protein [Alkalihalobacillus sp. AL-G]WLD92177.1 YrhC family protein [Alkalihalobacillus sp. AL-G]